MMKLLLQGIFLIFIFTGCASKGVWINPKIQTQQELNIQIRRDDSYCDAVSYGVVPMPVVVINNSYSGTNSGTFNAKNLITGNNYSGTYTSYPSPANSFSQGFSNGATMGASIRANMARLNIWKSCMYNLGWLPEEEYLTLYKIDSNSTK